MLISMPTGTSTILGAFQAILALLAQNDVSAPTGKLMRVKNFASEILRSQIDGYFALQKADSAEGAQQMPDEPSWCGRTQIAIKQL